MQRESDADCTQEGAMRRAININDNWHFQIEGKYDENVNIPHTWNAIDGQDGGNDYLRTKALYEKSFDAPDYDSENERVYLQFDGVNSECSVRLNGEEITRHEGGYSTFRKDITDHLKNTDNHLELTVDNSPNDRVYPQKADFTFYGGIYRDVTLLIVNKSHFDLDYYGGSGIQITAKPVEGYKKGEVEIRSFGELAAGTDNGGPAAGSAASTGSASKAGKDNAEEKKDADIGSADAESGTGNTVVDAESEAGAYIEYTITDADGNVVESTRKTNLFSPDSRHVSFDSSDASPDNRDISSDSRHVSSGSSDVSSGSGASFRDTTNLTIENVNLWNGVKNPYLYTLTARLMQGEKELDSVTIRFGVRDFHYHPKTGFYLNGKSYALHGVSRHQDRKGVGNAITNEMHREDMDLICEMGANTIRLAHYQHSQYFYDLCDERGMVVWAEIPYISEHMPNGRDNTISQMKELIVQNYNHPSIVCWGVSNEITISTKDNKDMMDNHRVLNDLCHRLDKTRFTTLACYAMCGPFNKVAHITDTVSWNLYLGWYVPGLFLNDLWMRFFHLVYPNRCLGYSEYGCEGMPNLHSKNPKRGDHTEEYQAIYHEYMLRCFERNPFMWATHVWNMFDFAADARNQGGEPGMNHKGLVTFDRKTKKDAFYLYKAWWSSDPFVHITSKRYKERTENEITIKVYSNQNEITLFRDGKKVGTRHGKHIFEFRVKLDEKKGASHEFKAVSGLCHDSATFMRASKENPAYKLKDAGDKGANWASAD